MADGIKLEIVSPEKLVFSAQVDSATVPGTEGYFTVMGDHAPLMSTLKPGFITVNTASASNIFYVRGGFVDVNNAGLTILAEQAQPIDEFEKHEIESALEEARGVADAAQGDHDRSAAHLIVSSLENLLIEAAHLDGIVH